MEHAADLKRLGSAIRAARQELGMSQEAFADSIQMHRAYYGAIERGVHNLTLETLFRVCRGLKKNSAEVLRHAGL